jgi:hypothetical protein
MCERHSNGMRDLLAPAAPIERIRHHLVSLRMPRALEALDHIVQQLERGEANPGFAVTGQTP